MQLPPHVSQLLQLFFNQSSNESLDPGLITSPCPLLGQIYPPPVAISSSHVWREAIANLDAALNGIPSVSRNESSYAVQIISLHESSPLYEHYGKASDHLHGKDGSKPVDGDTIFRIASVSKMFTVNALLLKCGFKCFEDPITKYIPELAHHDVLDQTRETVWDEITVGSLAAQISGLGRDYALGDFSTTGSLDPGMVGLPSLDPSELTHCGGDPANPPCTHEGDHRLRTLHAYETKANEATESIELILKHPPAFPTWYTPSYSNTAFQLLGYALQNMTGQSFEEVVSEAILKPLGLHRTSVALPSLADGITMAEDPTFGWNLGDEAPSGGIYSSTSDLATHAQAILNNVQLTPSQTRRWLKPHSHTAMLRFSFGAPWEIKRIPGLSAFHVVDFYTKSGDLGLRGLTAYTTDYALVPDLDIAIIVNSYSADPYTNAGVLGRKLADIALKPLFDVAKAQAIDRFGGTYVDERPHINSSLTVTSDHDIGLVVSQFISNGTDVLEALTSLGAITGSVRLFPSTLSSKEKDVGKIAFRATIVNLPGGCLSMFLVDSLKYAGIPLDLLVFETETHGQNAGKAHAVEMLAFRTVYRRVEETLQVQ